MENAIMLGLSVASLLISLIAIGLSCYVIISYAQRQRSAAERSEVCCSALLGGRIRMQRSRSSTLRRVRQPLRDWGLPMLGSKLCGRLARGCPSFNVRAVRNEQMGRVDKTTTCRMM